MLENAGWYSTLSDCNFKNTPFRMPELIAEETGHVLPEQEAYLYLIRAAQVLSGPVADLLEAHGVSGKQYNSLRSIRRGGEQGATVKEVRHQMTDPRADVTRLIDRLERDGLVIRNPDRKDRRVVRICLSEAGKSLLDQIDGPLLDIHRAQFAGFDRQAIETLKTLLMKLA